MIEYGHNKHEECQNTKYLNVSIVRQPSKDEESPNTIPVYTILRIPLKCSLICAKHRLNYVQYSTLTNNLGFFHSSIDQSPPTLNQQQPIKTLEIDNLYNITINCLHLVGSTASPDRFKVCAELLLERPNRAIQSIFLLLVLRPFDGIILPFCLYTTPTIPLFHYTIRKMHHKRTLIDLAERELAYY